MNSHERLIRDFYSAFNVLNAETMCASYHAEAVFSDPVFRNLNSQQTKAMWSMLTGSAKDLEVDLKYISVDNNSAEVKWEATYTFSRTNRKVYNRIAASFRFKDGLIIEHMDRFDLYRWNRMAFGLIGTLIGWTPFFKKKIRKMAMAGLDTFMDQ